MSKRDSTYDGPPEQVLEALRRAILARGYEIQGANPGTIFFRGGRKNMSGTASLAADGHTVLSLVGGHADQLHPEVATQLASVPPPAPSAESVPAPAPAPAPATAPASGAAA